MAGQQRYFPRLNPQTRTASSARVRRSFRCIFARRASVHCGVAGPHILLVATQVEVGDGAGRIVEDEHGCLGPLGEQALHGNGHIGGTARCQAVPIGERGQ